MSENLNNNFDEQNPRNSQTADDSANLYVKQYEKEQQQLAALEENAPQLSAPVDREINKKAIAFIVLAGFGLAGLGAFAYQQFNDSSEETPPQPERAQVVTVPDLPPPQPVATEAPPIAVADNTKAISEPVSTTPQVSTVPVMMEPPVTVTQQPVEMTAPLQNIPNNNIPVQMPVDSEFSGDSPFVQDGNPPQHAQGAVATTNAVRYLHNKDKLLVQGTYIRCVLETKIVSEVPGFTSCIVTEPVYSASGKYVLLPKGSKVMGQYGSSNPTSARLGVVWDRVITPDGVDVTLKSPGVDNLGAAGHVGKFKSHWASRLASALLISMISDTFKYAAAEYGPDGETVTTSSSTVTNPYESETADTLKQMAVNQLERNNARPNTVTINQGSLINIYTAQDIDFSTVIQ